MPKDQTTPAPPPLASRTRSRADDDKNGRTRRSARIAAVGQGRQPAGKGAPPLKTQTHRSSGSKKRAAADGGEPAHQRREDVKDAGRKCALCAAQRIKCVLPRGGQLACQKCRHRKVGCSLSALGPRPKRARRALDPHQPALHKIIYLLERIERNTRNAPLTASRAREEEEGSEVNSTT
ncbi:hypothetical protein MSAN_02293500 [Mycena sanguinolenta]|uniref:Zn(2)-C6 fungal-type domain-containing protein n=1 Tax=Mycena sanguinolenta TaxID=230812 RepID=A0A8H7CIH4_9AGAR|nr:hypothetical protein MSAN_02293500 [Mycena sanguinolenta]